jgi:hypothetical protein
MRAAVLCNAAAPMAVVCQAWLCRSELAFIEIAPVLMAGISDCAVVQVIDLDYSA